MFNARKAVLAGMLIAVCGGAAAANADQARPSPPIGADSAGMFFISYPRLSLQRNEEGTVEYLVNVAPDGLPLDCTVLRSSGHPRLDGLTCDAVVARARFIPATDEAGRRVRSRYAGRVDWRIR